MSQHLTQNQVQDYAQLKLPAADLVSVSDHLSSCEACRRLVEPALESDRTFFALRSQVVGAEAETVAAAEDKHPGAARFADYVDGMLAGEELQVVEDHLSACGQCALAVTDLRAFKEQVAPDINRAYAPASGRASTETWWHRAVGLLTLPKSPAWALGSVVLLFLLAAAAWLVWRTLDQKGNEKLAHETPSSTSTPPATAVSTPAASPTVATAPGVPMIAEINDGDRRVTLDREGKLAGVDHLSAAYQRMVKDSLINQRIAKSSFLAGLNRPPSSLMSGNDRAKDFSVTEPLGKVLQSDRPTFRWAELEGAKAYIVEVYDAGFNLVATSSQLGQNSWTSPQPLKRGALYSWQVKAIKDGEEIKSPRPPEPQAKFRILDSGTVSELHQARGAYGSSHLTLGLLYARAGLLDEAEREFRELQKANPDSALVRKLLSDVRKLRRGN